MNNARILIIDDNRDLADGLASILADTGYQAVCEYTGQGGIDAFSSSSFDLVFLDIKLPDMDGFAVYRALQAHDPQVNLLVITGYPPEQIAGQWPQVQTMRKPFDPSEMLATVDRLIGANGQP